MKVTKWFTIRETKTEKSTVLITTTDLDKEFNKGFKVEAFDKDGNQKKNWIHLDPDTDIIKITMMFGKKKEKTGEWEENEASLIEYNLKNCGWKINNDNQKITINPGKEEEFNKEIKNAHLNLLKEQFASEIDKKENIDGSSDMQYLIRKTDDNNDLVVSIYKNGDTTTNGKNFSRNRVKVEIDFYLKKKANLWDMIKIEVASPPKSESWWTSGKITFFLIVLVLLSGLVFAFRKKIWQWIKRESKQEKKVREQIDIF